MKGVNIGIVGCGFWANYQVAAWLEINGVNLVAVCDPDEKKGQALAAKFKIPKIYKDAGTMLNTESLDFIDIISSPETHGPLVFLAAKKGIGVICQKPMSLDWATAKKMVEVCASAQVPFYIHENFRWQKPMRRVKEILDAGQIGKPFKARIYFNTRFPVFAQQPSLAAMDRMIIADLGVHLFDLVRFFFGEAKSVFCRTQQITRNIKGEDVANTFIETLGGVHCYVELSWVSCVEYDCFPQTLLYIEGSEGSINLSKDFRVSIVRPEGIESEAIALPQYDWVHPDYAIAHSALVACNEDLLHAMQGQKESENKADLNLETLRIVFAAYESAEKGVVVELADYL